MASPFTDGQVVKPGPSRTQALRALNGPRVHVFNLRSNKRLLKFLAASGAARTIGGAMDIDLNSDLGEGCGRDADIMPLVTSANIACGFHAGDYNTASEAIALAGKLGVRIGAHPGYPDREHFGRREQHLSEAEIRRLCAYQIGALLGLAKLANVDHRLRQAARGPVSPGLLGRGVRPAGDRRRRAVRPAGGGLAGLAAGDAVPRALPVHRRGFCRPPLPRGRLAGAALAARCVCRGRRGGPAASRAAHPRPRRAQPVRARRQSQGAGVRQVAARIAGSGTA